MWRREFVFFDIFFFQAEDGIRDTSVTGVQTCALPISPASGSKGFIGGVSFTPAGERQDNSRRYSAHPTGWMRRNWTVGPKPTKRSECADFPAGHQTGD